MPRGRPGPPHRGTAPAVGARPSGTDAELAKARGRVLVNDRVRDVAGHLLCYRGQEGIDLGRLPLRDEFDLAGGQVPDVARDRVAPGQPLGGVAETDPLDAARVVDALAD